MSTLEAGTKLGRYEIRSKIGEGGIGEVYRARDDRLNRDVAIKVLPADLSTNGTGAGHSQLVQRSPPPRSDKMMRVREYPACDVY